MAIQFKPIQLESTPLVKYETLVVISICSERLSSRLIVVCCCRYCSFRRSKEQDIRFRETDAETDNGITVKGCDLEPLFEGGK